MVKLDNGKVLHLGKFENGTFKNDDQVECKIDPRKRLLNRRNHSAGHAIDVAVSNFSFDWKATKGYHFPEGCNVEYEGKITETKEIIRQKIETEVNNVIEEHREVKIIFITNKDQITDEIKRVLSPSLDLTNDNLYIRLIQIGDALPCPCGGTHVDNTSEIGKLVIRKLETSKGKIKISYKLSDQ